MFLPLSQTQRKSPDTKYDKRDDGPNETDTLMNQKGPSDLATDEVHLDEEETGRSSCSCQQTKPVKQHNGEKALKDNNDAEEIVKICDLNKDVGDDLIIIEQSNKNQMARKSTSILTNYLVLLKRGEFLLFFVSQFLFIFGFYLPFVFLPDKAKGLGKFFSEYVSFCINKYFIQLHFVTYFCSVSENLVFIYLLQYKQNDIHTLS